jgi:hypothetical protein
VFLAVERRHGILDGSAAGFRRVVGVNPPGKERFLRSAKCEKCPLSGDDASY